MGKRSLTSYLVRPLWGENQILVPILGICSALAITNKLSLAFAMSISVIFVTSFSSLIVSLIRHITPESVRMMTQLTIISFLVTIVDQFLQAYFFSLSKMLSVFVGLIITNCIVMGRTEGFARNQPPFPAFLDGIGAGLGYSLVICFIGFVREFLAFGQILGRQIIPFSWYASEDYPNRYENLVLMAMPTASFFIIGLLVGFHRFLNQQKNQG